MSELEQKIQAASERNSQLLSGLAENDFAPQKLYQQINYIADLDTQIVKSEKEVHVLKMRTSADLEQHKKYSESTFRRFAHIASGRKGRFEEKAAKEEKDYYDAMMAQKTAEDGLAYARQLRAEAEIERNKVETQAQRHDTLQHELDELYNSIFAGFTPGMPEEDAKESAVAAAQQTCARFSEALERERQVVRILNECKLKLQIITNELSDARNSSRGDLFGGDTLFSMMKLNALQRANNLVSQLVMLQDQLRNVKPDIGNLGPINIDTGSIWSDVVFDNIFTDMEMHAQIKQNQEQVAKSTTIHNRLMDEAAVRVNERNEELQRASRELQTARQELQIARQEVFIKVARGEHVQAQDPRITGVNSDSSTLSPGAPLPLPVPDDFNEAPPAYSA
ncbi:hypothetical protein BU24DRAFT_250544 [Aaosphaeria arxii CBS 175.79]|uniref:Uncharacterized protein n=1 Tax=Aaosphaeria arxii CBS 175.79 TaxID=1450172 RepID=A0A6A5XMF2_9PLEO|nr:uncharacterized protein BU24DRAFT_250544 [Aaosphaeria arxii CBS 175.79]KAF2013991.1 hypothetical protein BU24DRAFT_250544 [Aaosphaeria arxii CBS 175.79]